MNKATIDGILGDFHTVSGMDISVLNANFHTVSVKRREGSFCSFVHKDRKILSVCRTSDVERLDEVKKNCEAVIYTCPCGITEAIVPVMREGGVIAYIFCSMGIKDGCVECALCDTAHLADELPRDELCNVVKRCKILSEEEISAYFALLKIVAEHIARDPSPAESDESI